MSDEQSPITPAHRLVFNHSRVMNVDTLEFAQETINNLALLHNGIMLGYERAGITPSAGVRNALSLVSTLVMGSGKMGMITNPEIPTLVDMVSRARQELSHHFPKKAPEAPAVLMPAASDRPAQPVTQPSLLEPENPNPLGRPIPNNVTQVDFRARKKPKMEVAPQDDPGPQLA